MLYSDSESGGITTVDLTSKYNIHAIDFFKSVLKIYFFSKADPVTVAN